jgi:tRNA(adenine34) deaminase
MQALTDDDFMRQALHEARKASDQDEVPIGAVIIHRGQVLGRGQNRTIALQDPTAHAEMLAITAAASALGSWRLEECTLYVTLEPCPMCAGACLNARIPRVVYAAPEPKFGALGSVVDLRAPHGYNHRLDVSGGILAADSADLLRAFFRKVRDRKNGAQPT